jgi:hypothetical protein
LCPAAPDRRFGGCLHARSDAFRGCVEAATLDTFRGYKTAIDEHLEDAVAVLDASSSAVDSRSDPLQVRRAG